MRVGKIRIELPDCALSTEHQAVVDALNAFLAWLPDDDDPDVALRLAMGILEAADAAPQEVWAQATGFTPSCSVRVCVCADPQTAWDVLLQGSDAV
jgi:hypothetical protein